MMNCKTDQATFQKFCCKARILALIRDENDQLCLMCWARASCMDQARSMKAQLHEAMFKRNKEDTIGINKTE